jgi:PPOX class probable F420-dependent enzyme
VGAVELSESDRAFLAANQSAAMITIGADGMPKAVRVGVGLVDGKVWSSGTRDRARTARLRKDPRCTLFVFDQGYGSITLETTVTILDGPDVPDLSVRLFRTMQDAPEGPLSWFGGMLDEDAFRQAMVDEHRIIYEFTPTRAYGLH